MTKVKIDLSSIKKEENKTKDNNEDVEISRLDKRLQRLQRLKESDDTNERQQNSQLNRRRRREFEPEVIEEETIEEQEPNEDVENRHALIRERLIKEQEDNEEDYRSNQAQQSNQQNKINELECSEDEDESDIESSDEEDESEDEFFNSAPRFKPVFKRKEDRHSINDQKKEAEENAKREELKKRKEAEDRRKEALRIIESTIQREKIEKDEQDEANFESINSVQTDDESEEVAYLNWKLREMKRNKRDKDEREALIREKEEIERLRNMTEEERLEELKRNPKVIVNQQEKGKYRFMQKYYHRGAFFMDEEDDIYKRDVAKPTLEDHFDKTSLPKVMQVKNFGRSGQTKYTHLVDQDTTDHQSPWYNANINQSAKTFAEKHGGGMKQQLERPSKRRKN